MNLPITKTAPPMAWHLLLETLHDGQVVAWVAELPDCRVMAASREAAIAQLEPLVQARMATIEVLPWAAEEFVSQTEAATQLAARRQTLIDLPKIDQHDPDFIEFMAALRAERELEDDNPAYTINW